MHTQTFIVTDAICSAYALVNNNYIFICAIDRSKPTIMLYLLSGMGRSLERSFSFLGRTLIVTEGTPAGMSYMSMSTNCHLCCMVCFMCTDLL